MTWICKLCDKVFYTRKNCRDHIKADHRKEWKDTRKFDADKGKTKRTPLKEFIEIDHKR